MKPPIVGTIFFKNLGGICAGMFGAIKYGQYTAFPDADCCNCAKFDWKTKLAIAFFAFSIPIALVVLDIIPGASVAYLIGLRPAVFTERDLGFVSGNVSGNISGNISGNAT